MDNDLDALLSHWTLPGDGPLLDRIERLIEPVLLSGYFTQSSTCRVCGVQYHLGGAQDTTELAELAGVKEKDLVLDVCCFLGGPAVQLASTVRCQVVGIDINARVIAAAQRIAHLTGLESLLHYSVADARQLPFANEQFTVVWSQGSAAHDETWFTEFDRVLQPGGRLAITIATNQPPEPWSLPDIVKRISARGYTIIHADDLTVRDIEIGWRALDAKLTVREAEYLAALGPEWVADAHCRFQHEIRRMQAGEWGNGRIVAQKRESRPPSGG